MRSIRLTFIEIIIWITLKSSTLMKFVYRFVYLLTNSLPQTWNQFAAQLINYQINKLNVYQMIQMIIRLVWMLASEKHTLKTYFGYVLSTIFIRLFNSICKHTREMDIVPIFECRTIAIDYSKSESIFVDLVLTFYFHLLSMWMYQIRWIVSKSVWIFFFSFVI